MSDKWRRDLAERSGHVEITEEALRLSCLHGFDALHIETHISRDWQQIVCTKDAMILQYDLSSAKLESPQDMWLFHGTTFTNAQDLLGVHGGGGHTHIKE